MLFDTRLSWPIFVIYILCCIFTFLDGYHILVIADESVTCIRDMQAWLLLFFAIFSYFYMHPFKLPNGQKQFWLWSVAWWLLLFGISTQWGQDYFPQIPHVISSIISIVMIAIVIGSFLNRALREEISRKLKTSTVSIWGVLFIFLGLIISESISHGWFLSHLFLYNPENKAFMEEVYEFPLIAGLFMVAYDLMQIDKKQFEFQLHQR